jgi:hypothetical protein
MFRRRQRELRRGFNTGPPAASVLFSGARGDIAGRKRHNDKDNSEADKDERIAGRDAVEQSRHQVRHHQCADKPHGGASKGECNLSLLLAFRSCFFSLMPAGAP